MIHLPTNTVREPHDIVDGPVGVCGVGTGFEGVISAHVRWQPTASDGEHLHMRNTRRAGRGIKRQRSSSRYY